MSLTNEQVIKLLTEKYSFSHLGFSMLLMRLRASYIKDKSEAALILYTKEIDIFIQKFGYMMVSDLEIIKQL